MLAEIIARKIGRGIGTKIARDFDEESRWLEDTLAGMPATDVRTYKDRYAERKKTLGGGYLFWLLGGSHYLYTGRYVKQAVFWLTAGGLLFWWMLDGLLMFFVVDKYNRDLAVKIIEEIFEDNAVGRPGVDDPEEAEQAPLAQGVPSAGRHEAEDGLSITHK